MNPVVSIIIPCYNAEQWIAESLQSCLDQVYQPIEIIIIDDGSTDDSLKVLRAFEKKIHLETSEHRGGCYARNFGFTISKGKYVQFLDADDYLLPEKIEQQVFFLEESKADVVYGDWRHQYHQLDGKITLGDVQVSGEQVDILESLLRGWWTASVSLLMCRDIVSRCGGWDNQLAVGQDRDFFISLAMAGADIRYQPGCFTVYRRYGNVTVSTSNKDRWLESHHRLLEKAESNLTNAGLLSTQYRRALAQSYFVLARNYYDIDQSKYDQLLVKVLSLDPNFRPTGSVIYRLIQRVLGYGLADNLASRKRKFVR